MHRATALAAQEAALPGHSVEALRLRQTALSYAFLVNTGNRQGDLRLARIGQEIIRGPDGLWRHDLRQAKSGRRKEMETLWPGTCALPDAHLLADRQAWQIERRVADLDGVNLLTLSDAVVHKSFLNRRLEEDFRLAAAPEDTDAPKLTGHLIRTLIVDGIRRARPDAQWAAQHLLGHAERTMREIYRNDFRESEAVLRMDETLARIEAAAGELALLV